MKHKHTLARHYSTVHLSEKEKEEMLLNIRAHIIRPSRAVKSPFTPLFSYVSRPVAAALILTVCGMSTSGVAYASQSALPDETLYPIKRLEEKIETFFARTSHAQVHTAGVHALTRIQEATRMHLAGRMTKEVESELSESIRSELLHISHVVAEQEQDTPTARESAVVLGKVVGYTNVLSQAIESSGGVTESTAATSDTSRATPSPLVEQVEYFVDTHEDAIAGAVSNDNSIVAEHFISEIGSSFIEQTSDPLVEATITAVISSEHVSDMFPDEKGSRVLHALADMAEGTASVEAMNAHVSP